MIWRDFYIIFDVILPIWLCSFESFWHLNHLEAEIIVIPGPKLNYI